MFFQPELVRLTAEQHRDRLLREAAEMRLLKAIQSDMPAQNWRRQLWLQQVMATARRWYIRAVSNQQSVWQSAFMVEDNQHRS